MEQLKMNLDERLPNGNARYYEIELLNENLEKYFELKAKKEDYEAQVKHLNGVIVEQLEMLGEKKHSSDEYSATLSYKESIKYNDEKALIELLKKDDDLKSYVIEAINTKGLNELIKSSKSVATKLNESYTKSSSSSLTVKKI